MIYNPISAPEQKQKWIDWLTSQVSVLNGKPEVPSQNSINETPEGDVATAKDLVGNFLALLTGKPVEIK